MQLVMKKPLILLLGSVGLMCTAASARAEVGEMFGTVVVSQPDKVMPGRMAFVDASQSKLIEIDQSGKITWEFSIPNSMNGAGKLSSGTDVEWIASSDHFLLAVPSSGVYEIDRQGQTVWKYLTPFADHDADRLPDGNTVFVNGWDADSDPVMTEVDASGKVVYQLFANDLHLNSEERHNVANERYSNTHANAVQKLGPGEYLLSLRNFNQFMRIKDGKIVETVKHARNVHDPMPYKGGYLFALHQGESRSTLAQVDAEGQRKPFFSPGEGTWTPLRTLELLRNGNILITGGREVGQLDAEGRLVWSLTAGRFDSGKAAQKSGRFFYKAAFVYK